MPRVPQELRTFTAAAGEGDIDVVREMIRHYAPFAEDWRPIMEASLKGQAEVVELLLKNNADPDIKSVGGDPFKPLHRAIIRRGDVPKTTGHIDTVNILLKYGADPRSRSHWSEITPLACAAHVGDRELVDVFLPFHTSLDIHHASITSDVDTVKSLLTADGALVDSEDVNGLLPIHYACMGRLLEDNPDTSDTLRTLGELLLQGIADIDRHAPGAFYWAARTRNATLGEVLADRVKDPSQAFHFAVDVEHSRLLHRLILDGLDLDTLGGDGKNKLHATIRSGHPISRVMFLLDHGADPNVQSGEEGWSALHFAASRGSSARLIKALLERGARLDVKDRQGRTAYDIAVRKGKDKVAGLLEPE